MAASSGPTSDQLAVFRESFCTSELNEQQIQGLRSDDKGVRVRKRSAIFSEKPLTPEEFAKLSKNIREAAEKCIDRLSTQQMQICQHNLGVLWQMQNPNAPMVSQPAIEMRQISPKSSEKEDKIVDSTQQLFSQALQRRGAFEEAAEEGWEEIGAQPKTPQQEQVMVLHDNSLLIEMGSQQCRVIQSDLLTPSDDDAKKQLFVVNAGNTHGRTAGNSGVNGAIIAQGGAEYRKGHQALAAVQGGKIPEGEGFFLPPGNLQAEKGIKGVVYTVAPDLKRPVIGPRQPTQEDRQKLFDCYYHSLQVAQEKGAEVVYMPVLGVGSFAWPMEDSADIAHEAISRFFTDFPNSSVQTVRICAKEQAAFNACRGSFMPEE